MLRILLTLILIPISCFGSCNSIAVTGNDQDADTQAVASKTEAPQFDLIANRVWPNNQMVLKDFAQGRPTWLRDENAKLINWPGNSEKLAEKGRANNGIYRVYDLEGKSTILKILLDQPGNGDPRRLINTIEGMKLCEKEGGSKVVEYGTIQDPDQSSYFYVRMEELFPGKQVGFLKDAKDRADPQLIEMESSGKDIFGPIGKKLAEAFDHHIIPDDPDFAYDLDGNVRWSDGAQWIPFGMRFDAPVSFGEHIYHTLAYAYKSMGSNYALRETVMKRLLGSFVNNVKNGKHYYESDKIITELFIQDRAFEEFVNVRSVSSSVANDIQKIVKDFDYRQY